MNIEHDAICQSIMEMFVEAMGEKKKNTFCNACDRNGYLTSHFGMSWYTLSTYKEGWYFECGGTRCAFAVWAWDRDGEMEIGRKPNKDNIHFIWAHTFSSMPISLRKIYFKK